MILRIGTGDITCHSRIGDSRLSCTTRFNWTVVNITRIFFWWGRGRWRVGCECRSCHDRSCRVSSCMTASTWLNVCSEWMRSKLRWKRRRLKVCYCTTLRRAITWVCRAKVGIRRRLPSRRRWDVMSRRRTNLRERRREQQFSMITQRWGWKAWMGDGTWCDICHGRGLYVLMLRSNRRVHSLYKNWKLWIIRDWPHGSLLNKGRWDGDIP